MAERLSELFCWRRAEAESGLSASERGERMITWSREARSTNPNIFDCLTAWLLDDAQWSPDRIEENRCEFMDGIVLRFIQQNARLRADLLEIGDSAGVSASVFAALDRFDAELSGRSADPALQENVARVFEDFSAMLNPDVRKCIAGCASGPTGTDTIDFYGYVNMLKDCDAQVQWSLFMPDTVQRQQCGFRVERFDCVRAPAMRFIGRETDDPAGVFAVLDSMRRWDSPIAADALFMHHRGLGVDVERRHALWGRFMLPDASAPEGFVQIDLMPTDDGQFGPPYRSQYAIAEFSGDAAAMHRREGFDSDAMYDVTRNMLLAQGVMIPYPHKYWTAELFPKGFDQPGNVYLFSVALD